MLGLGYAQNYYFHLRKFEGGEVRGEWLLMRLIQVTTRTMLTRLGEGEWMGSVSLGWVRCK